MSRSWRTPEAPGTIWHGTILEVNGDELTLDLRQEGSPDLLAEVSASRWNLQDAEVGDVIVIDTENQTAARLNLGRWTQAEIDDITARAEERYRQMMRCLSD